jgi:sensor histidine kinase YesM
VTFRLDLPSLGFVLDGLATVGLIVGVCVYHSESRGAADSLLRERIAHTGLDAELQRAQLQVLRTQIEPHFLFNTLSVVRALSRSDRRATVDVLQNLIRYFEAALPRLRESEVPLRQELELVEAFLAICQKRMGARLQYEIDAAETLLHWRVPSMAVLTLVENALKHGVTPLSEGGAIRIAAAVEEGALQLSVTDTGRGLDLSQGRGTGLANLRQRLVLMYGSEAVLSLSTATPQGVVATIGLPSP